MLHKDSAKNILLIRLGALGDVVQTLPLLRQLQANFPKCRFFWAIEDKSKPLIEELSGVELILFPKKKLFQWNLLASLWNHFRFGLKIRTCKIDLALDLQGLFKSGWLAFLSSAPHRIGFDRQNSREFSHLFMNLTLPYVDKTKMHRIDFYQRMVPFLGGQIQPMSDPFEFPLNPQELRESKILLHRLRLRPPFMILNLGTSKATKRWTVEGYVKTIESARKHWPRTQILLTGGGQQDLQMEEDILRRTGPGLVVGSVNKTSLGQLSVLVKNSCFVLSPDSLVLHLASAFKIPAIGLFGGSALPEETKPWPGHTVGLNNPLECYPCRRKTCSHHSCMVGLGAERIIEEMLKIMPADTRVVSEFAKSLAKAAEQSDCH